MDQETGDWEYCKNGIAGPGEIYYSKYGMQEAPGADRATYDIPCGPNNTTYISSTAPSS